MLCSSHRVEMLDFWFLRQRMALSMAAGMTMELGGVTAGAEGLRSHSRSCGCRGWL